MIKSTTTYDLQTTLQLDPKVKPGIEELRRHTSAFAMTRGAFLSAVLPPEFHDMPMLVIASRRISDGWPATVGGAELTLDGCSSGFESVEYLAWQGNRCTLAIAVPDIIDVIDENSGNRKVLILWVTDTQLVLDWLETDKHFQEMLYVASRSRHLSRFVPDEEYVAAKMSSFSPLLEEGEERLIGINGEPMYVVRNYEQRRAAEK